MNQFLIELISKLQIRSRVSIIRIENNFFYAQIVLLKTIFNLLFEIWDTLQSVYEKFRSKIEKHK
jgi:hypothetical protein